MSSLATQLHNISSLDAGRLTSRTGAPTSQSYLFPPKVAASHDLDAIFSLAQSGFDELLTMDPGFQGFEDELFSERAKRVDRMMLNQDENRRLDEVLGRCLRRLGRWVGVMAGGKCIEWLVRRFRVHEFNAETLLQVFLPYHESPNFPRILSILTLSATSPYHAPFAALIKKAQPIPRSYITTAIAPARDPSLRLLNDVAGMIQQALKEKVVHRAMLNFWSATMVELLDKARSGKGVNEGLVKIMVEHFVGILSTPEAGVDVNAAVYPPLVLLTRTIRLADGPFLALVSAMLTPATGADPAQRVLTLLVILSGRPEWTQGLGQHGSDWLAKISDLGNLLVTAMEKYGLEEGVRILIPVMLEKFTTHGKHLKALATSEKLPASLAKIIAEGSYAAVDRANNSAAADTLCQDIMRSLRVVHSGIEQAASQTRKTRASTSSADFEDQPGTVNAYSADVLARRHAVGQIYDTLDRIDVDDEERQAASDALLVLLADQDEALIDSIYGHQGILPGIDALDYLKILSRVVREQRISPVVLAKHMRYISAVFLPDKPDLARSVFELVIFPCLFTSTGRAPLGKALGMLDITTLSRIDTFNAMTTISSTHTSDVETNLAVAQAISDGINASEDRDSYITFLLTQLDDPLLSAKHMAHLVLIRLLTDLQGDQQVTTAVSVLDRLQPLLQDSTLRDADVSDDPLDKSLVEAMTTKPSKKRTGQRATVELISAILKVARCDGQAVCWIGSETTSYKRFAEHIYALANGDILPPGLAAVLLRHLLTQLGEESLVFFASIWTSTAVSSVRLASLRHAVAFVRAYAAIGEEKKGMDFQMALPAVLVALQDPDKGVRSAGAALLRSITSLADQPSATIYAVDTFYGARSDKVQLLKHTDLQPYLRAISSASNDLITDANRLSAVHNAIMGSQHNKGKKESSHRRAVIGALLSHVQAWQSMSVRRVILRSLAGIHDQAILRGIFPLMRALTAPGDEEIAWLRKESNHVQDNYLHQLFEGLSQSAAAVIADDQSGVFGFLTSLLDESASPYQARMRDLSLGRLSNGVFNALPVAQKVSYVIALVNAITKLPSDEATTAKAVLPKLVLEPSAMVEIVERLSEALETVSHRKKQKGDESVEREQIEQAITSLTVFVEIRDWSTIPGIAPLVATLMTVLSALLTRRQSVKEGIDYLEQEVLGAILALLEKIRDPTEVQKAHVGIEVIIKVIRASANPRTSQRALLVASELTRLMPEAVLHNVMPIFTFMGASDFQRDAAYSFGVVEKTVSRIVPVMTKSLKEKATSKLQLHNESLTFLGIFTDMAGRLPKHRTTPFFVHLVKSLGPSDFLAPVSMLLVQRSNTKAGRAGSTSSHTVELPLSVTGAFDSDTKLEAVLETVGEVARLVADLSRDEKEGFLSSLTTDADGNSLKQITSLLQYCNGVISQMVGTSCQQTLVEDIVKHLVVLSGSREPALQASGFANALDPALGSAMQLLSATSFLGMVHTLLDSQQDQDVTMALQVFVERLPRIKTDVRSSNTAIIADISVKLCALLSPSSQVVSSVLSALKVITSTASSAEDGALAQVVPKLVEVVGKLPHPADQISAQSLIELLIRRLVSRVIPAVQSIVESSLNIIKSSRSSPAVTRQSFATLVALVETVPTFISSKNLTAILQAGIAYRIKDSAISASLISPSAKKIPTKSLFPVVMDLWKPVQKQDESAMKAFFDLLRLTLRNADRQALPALIKPVFAFFLDVFDLRHRLQLQGFDAEIISGIEGSAIGSFLEFVTKLNETTFKPLFIRLYDWAVIDLADGKAVDDGRLVERKIVLLHVMMGLLQKFKHLLSPYIGILLPHLEELLPAYAESTIIDIPLWTLLLDVLAKSFEVDDGAFWTDALYLRIIPLLTAQLSIFTDMTSSPTSPVSRALASLAASTSTESVLKKLNTNLCLVTRSDIPRERMAALRALDAVWEKQSEEMLPFVPETVSEFLAELLEDENGDVETLARVVLGRIEKMTGSLKEYLE